MNRCCSETITSCMTQFHANSLTLQISPDVTMMSGDLIIDAVTSQYLWHRQGHSTMHFERVFNNNKNNNN